MYLRSTVSTITILVSRYIVTRTGRAVTEGITREHVGVGKIFCNAFVTAAPVHSSISRHSSSESSSDMREMLMKNQSDFFGSRVDVGYQSLWMYHVESTTSTMDEAKLLVERNFTSIDNDTSAECSIDASSSKTNLLKSFIISASSQTNGRGTSKRNWKSTQMGNALFTIGIQQSAWVDNLKSRNNGRIVPLTLLPLKVGSSVASNVQRFLMENVNTKNAIPKVTVKWPNDVLLLNTQSSNALHEKVAGILIESYRDWLLIGIGINVGYAPDIPLEGPDYGRRAAALSGYIDSAFVQSEKFWIEISKQLGKNIAHDLHTWLYPASSSSSSLEIGDLILDEWKSFVDWDMKLVLRDTPKREEVTLKEVLKDGRVVVEEVETGTTRTLVSDYFL